MFDKTTAEKIKEQVTQECIRLTYPSVIPASKIPNDYNRNCWIALWIQNGIPQHCQCTTEEEGWWLIGNRMRII